jgi:hypothetical protein
MNDRDLVAAMSFAVQMHQVFLDGRNPPSEDTIHNIFCEAKAVAELFSEQVKAEEKKEWELEEKKRREQEEKFEKVPYKK